MSARNERNSSSADDALGTLLSGFFAQEMPEQLRHLDASPVASVSAIPPRAATQGRAAALLVAAAVVVLMTVALGKQAARDRDPSENAPGDAVSEGAAEPAASRVTGQEAAVAARRPAQESSLVEHFETPAGPVEYRENIRWTEVSVVEPETGTERELLLPELNIEVFPIEPRATSDDVQP